MRTELVGRHQELAALDECLDAAVRGQAGLVLCHGEPGIGKTRLAEELASTAAGRGVVTAWGRAVEAAGAPPYWPWRHALRCIAEHTDLQALAADRGLTADLGRLWPEVFGTTGVGPAVDPSEERRFWTFDAFARLLRRVTLAFPLLVVLDDAHRADASSLLLLQHVARTMAGQRLLLVVLHRDGEPVPDVLPGLRREAPVRELVLRGLTAPAVGAQLTELLRRVPTAAETHRVHARTGGNPFYVAEVARVLAGEDSPDDRGVPDAVCTAVATRVARLPAPVGRVLAAASVVGREFDVAVVAGVAGFPVLRCLAVLDAAAAAGLVEEGSLPGERRFVHDLVRDAVEAGLDSPTRVLLHRSAAEVIERRCAGSVDRRSADLARHWAVAAVAGDRVRAVRWIRQAADESMDRLAYEEAARLYRLAVTVGSSDLDDDVRCRLLLAAGTALKLGGNLAERLQVSRDVAGLARRLGRPDLLAEAALLVEGGECDPGPVEIPVRRWCEEALATMDPAPSALRARVLANLSDECMYLVVLR